jgi:hypothetical protein
MRFAAPSLLFLALAIRPLAAAVPGRDFWPADLTAVDFIAPPTEGTDQFFASDSVLYEGTVYVFVYHTQALYLATYDLDSGALDIDLDRPLLEPSGEADTPDEFAVTNVAVQPCRARRVVDVPLEWDGAVCRLPNIGVDPDSLSLRSTAPAEEPAPEPAKGGCGCGGGATPAPAPTTGDPSGRFTFERGRDDGTTRTTDGLRPADPTESCEDLVATYDYTICSLGDDAWRCPVPGEEDVRGACGWFMMWESEGEIDGNDSSPNDRVVNLAHAAVPGGPWEKYAEDGGTTLTPEDVRVRFTGPHAPEHTWTKQSFASVPDLWFDPVDGVWRMWITGEAGLQSAMWYLDSPDDGLTWGIDTYGVDVDCWSDDLGDYDPAVCTQVAWEGDGPPNDPETSRTPDAVDFCVYDDPEAAGNEVAVMFTAANSACIGEPREGAFLFGRHPDGGDQRSGVDYTWEQSVEMDAETGLVIAYDRTGDCSVVLHDFNITQVADSRYVMFFTQVPPNGIHVAGSGFACSDFADNDGDGETDFGFDPDCESPTDDSE